MKVNMAADPEHVRKQNRSLILEQLNCDIPLSRVEISKKLALSKMTVSVIVADLIREGLVDEVGEGEAARSGGRKPILLTLGSSKFVLGIDIGQTNTVIAMANLKGEKQYERKVPTSRNKEVGQIVRQIAELVRESLAKSGVKSENLFCVGISTAGLVESDRGYIHFSPDFNWKDVPLKSLMEEAIGFPVVVDNCTRALALGEIRYGGAKDAENLFFVNVGHGIGSALMINGTIYGKNSEFGHIRATSKAIVCDCGKEGCLEAVSSGHAIERRAAELYPEESGWMTAEEVAALARKGDDRALELFGDAGRYLGRAIAIAVNLFNPDKVIIGGGVSMAGCLILDPLMEAFQQDAMEVIKDSTTVELTRLGTESGVRGAIALALNSLLFSHSTG
jgi:N-acetylglucosamine repressor